MIETEGFDGAMADRFGLSDHGIPFEILLDREGTVVAAGLSSDELLHRIDEVVRAGDVSSPAVAIPR